MKYRLGFETSDGAQGCKMNAIANKTEEQTRIEYHTELIINW